MEDIACVIREALNKGAKIYASVSGGKDGQAMVKTLVDQHYPVEGLIHADLGRVEWPQSMEICKWLSDTFHIPLHVVRRTDKLDLLDYWRQRMLKLKGTGKPFWSSAVNRYCTSGMKVQPINKLLTELGGFVISAEGIRAGESDARANKMPLSIRRSKSSSYYLNMTVKEAVQNFTPGKRLVLNWYPVFRFTVEQVWATFGMSAKKLMDARELYRLTGKVADWWNFHRPTYLAMTGSAVHCVYWQA